MIAPTFARSARFLDAAHTAFIWSALWSYLINDYGVAAIIDDIHWCDLPLAPCPIAKHFWTLRDFVVGASRFVHDYKHHRADYNFVAKVTIVITAMLTFLVHLQVTAIHAIGPHLSRSLCRFFAHRIFMRASHLNVQCQSPHFDHNLLHVSQQTKLLHWCSNRTAH